MQRRSKRQEQRRFQKICGIQLEENDAQMSQLVSVQKLVLQGHNVSLQLVEVDVLMADADTTDSGIGEDAPCQPLSKEQK